MDPDDVPGLAHYLEHSKYTTAHSLVSIAHSGHVNCVTGVDHCDEMQ